MRRATRLPLIVAAVTLVALLVPAAALAADGVTVTGTVVRDGTPVTGVEVVVAVPATGIVVATASDENGAFAVELEASIGDAVEVHATGATSRSDPDKRGCVTSETPFGTARAVIDAVPPSAITVDLDQLITSKVCSATATPRLTPPSTDGPVSGARPAAGGGLPAVLGLLALAGTLALTLSRTRRSGRP